MSTNFKKLFFVCFLAEYHAPLGSPTGSRGLVAVADGLVALTLSIVFSMTSRHSSYSCLGAPMSLTNLPRIVSYSRVSRRFFGLTRPRAETEKNEQSGERD